MITIKSIGLLAFNGCRKLISGKHSIVRSVPTLLLLSILSCTAYAVDGSKPDVRIVVDISGSMKNNDPNNLRIPAVNMLIGLLPDDATAGVWTFGRYVNMLVPHRPISDKWRKEARRNVRKINSVGQFTNIELALKKAGYDLPSDKIHKNTHLILLTDGQVDISKNAAENRKSRRNIARELLKKYKDSGVRIHTVALSDQADHQLLRKLSSVTGGISTVAADADQLMQTFLQVLDQAAPQDQLPITGNTFQIDSSVEEATVLLFRKDDGRPTRLTDPDGNSWQAGKLPRNIKWYADEKFDLITVTKPIPGDWVIGSNEHPDNRVSVVSDLKLRVEGLPAVIEAGTPLEMSVFFLEKERLLDDHQFLGLIDTTIQIDRNGAKLGAAKVSNFPMVKGKYKVKLRSLSKYASYAILIEADGKTFSRKFQRIFKISPPLPDDPELDSDLFEDEQIEEEPIEEEIEPESEELMEHPISVEVLSTGTELDPKYDIILKIVDPTISTDSTQVISMVASPAGTTFIGTVGKVSGTQWEMTLESKELLTEGEYRIQFSFTGEQRNGTEFEYRPELLTFSHPEDRTAPEIVPEPEPEPEPIEVDVLEEEGADDELVIEEILIDTLEEEPPVEETPKTDTPSREEVRKLKEELMSLEIDKRVRDGLLDQMKQDRKDLLSQLQHHVETMTNQSRVIGQLETRLELSAPAPKQEIEDEIIPPPVNPDQPTMHLQNNQGDNIQNGTP
ncbi:MAG: VWA domain-containing protein [Gammaproteobacteria bacterium]|nr:VWA domain-containing protein [Gammaproteobacteria bacterium]